MAHTTSETSKYVGSGTVQRIKSNPGPAALAALGISWLFMGGKGSGTQVQTQTSQSSSGSMGQNVSDMAGQVQDAAGTMTDQVHDGMDTAIDQVQQTAGQVADQAQQVMSGAAGHVQQSAGQMSATVQQVPAKTRRMVEENPVPLGLVALAVGSAAALLLPETRKENQLMGEARDALVETAKSKGQEVAGKAQDVVEGMQTTVEGVQEVVEKSTK